jgi:hypothetical protein
MRTGDDWRPPGIGPERSGDAPADRDARQASTAPHRADSATGRDLMAAYYKRLASRITAGAEARLKLLALLRGRRLSHVLHSAPDQFLPTAAELSGPARLFAGGDPQW